ncbi:MAG: hypothetical protein JNK23_03375 [Opitutaceae bacterium]|nr:hypothetical protein [Opitutaceae bacterium]
MKSFRLLLILSLITSAAFADFFPPPAALFAASADGTKVVRVSREGAPKQTERVTVYAFNKAKDAYLAVRSFVLTDAHAGEFMFVSDDGRHVVFAGIGAYMGERGLGVWIFTDGKLAKRWKIEDLLTATEIEGCARTGATLQWLEQGTILDGALYLHGPARGIRGWGSSFTVMRGHDASVSYNFVFDLSKLELKKTVPEPR